MNNTLSPQHIPQDKDNNVCNPFDDILKDSEIILTNEYNMIHINSKGFTPLMMYSMEGKYLSIKKYLDTLRENGEHQLIHYIINQQNDKGWTPLMFACRDTTDNRNIETLKVLLENGADVRLKNDLCKNVWNFCVDLEDGDSACEIMKLLMQYNAHAHWKGKMMNSPIMKACVHIEHAKCLELFLDDDVDVNMQDEFGNTPLMMACSHSKNDSKFEIVKLLLERKADPHITNKFATTPFLEAYLPFRSINKDNNRISKLLLEYESNVDVDDLFL